MVVGDVQQLAIVKEVSVVNGGAALPGAERLELVGADLLEPDSIVEAIRGCSGVLHVASPFAMDAGDPRRDLVAPAVRGTLAVLTAAAEESSVKRVVVTSSIAALTDEPDGTLLSEESWNDKSSLSRNPYYYAKTEAERAAWRFTADRQPGFDLITILPAYVLGPSLVPRMSESGTNLVTLTDRTWPAIADFPWWVVDVRDAGLAHIRALERPQAHGRYIAAAAAMSMREVVDVLKGAGWDAKYKLPSLPLDNPVGTWLLKRLVRRQPPGTRSWLRTHLGGEFNGVTTKIEQELGIQFLDAKQTLLDAMEDLDRWGQLGKKH